MDGIVLLFRIKFCKDIYVLISFNIFIVFEVISLSKSVLLNVNNQKEYDSEAKRRFLLLEKLVLIGFKRDTMISPRESAFFYEYDEDHNLVNMKDTEIYKKDLFGLKTLDESNRIEMHFLDERHCYFSFQNMQDYVVPEVTP